MNYFSLLQIPEAFDLDMNALEQGYFREQRLSHPDRFAGKPVSERTDALQRSVDINAAYNALRNPLSRAQYLLHSEGIEVGTETDNVKPAPALLMEVMEWREALEESKDTTKLENLLNAAREESVKTISAAYKNNTWDSMAQETLRHGYILKTLEELLRKKRGLK